MKKILFLFSLMCILFAQADAQQVLIQNVDVRIDRNDIEYSIIHDATLYVEPCISLNQKKGKIDLLLVDAEGNLQGNFEVLDFDEAGGKGFMSNWEAFEAFQEIEYQARKDLQEIQEQIIFWSKRRTVAEYEKDSKLLAEIDETLASLTEQEVVIRDNPVFAPENRVNAKWVYTHTYDKFLNEYLNGYELTQAGLNLVADWVIYRSNEDKEITVRVGKMSDYFAQNSKKK